ncbi:MAG TPA: hypothetical protein VLS27_14150, partial [Gammaproteobacteria bacterium]|nr:hypothetical protein [Gammaproteobacteria bacterium]
MIPADLQGWEVWGMNGYHDQPWMPPATRWWQTHRMQEVLKYGNAQRHLEFLRSFKGLLYMQEAHPEFPASRPYPLDAVCRLTPRARKNLTSTAAQMLALAVKEGFRRIALYGIEAASEEEYVLQREGIAYWLGAAETLGVQIDIPPGCMLQCGRLYGYESAFHPLEEAWRSRIAQLDEEQRRLRARLLEIEGVRREYRDAVRPMIASF